MPQGNSFPNSFFSHNIGSAVPMGLTTGDVYWVNSAATNASDDNSALAPGVPAATLDGAIGKCTANNGDVIVVMENHAETVTGAGGITADVAGITIVGLGRGNQRPRFLMDGATTVTVVVTAADVAFENLVFAGGHDGIATCFNVDAVGFTARNLEFEDNTAAEHFIICFDCGSATDNVCDRLTIVGCRFYTLDTGVTHFINVTGDLDNAVITDNFYCADAATGAQLLVQATGDDMQGLQFLRNQIITGATAVDILIENDQTDNTGIAAWNLAGHHDVAAVVLCDADGIRQFQNYSTASDTASGLLLPVADLDST